ncbi:hypothetical protein ACFE04_015530 [Oxalis oulophora]
MSTLMISKKSIPSPLLLKDYLLDDFSSCSSNGFKSFPRRQCCTISTVRFLLEIDLNNKNKNVDDINKYYAKQQVLRRNYSKKAASAIQRASEKVINVVKLLPFASVKSRKMISLPRSFSRKMLKISFWRKSDTKKDDEEVSKEIKRWKSFGEYLEEKDQPSDQNINNDQVSITVSRSPSNCDSVNGYSWEESEFTKEIITWINSGNSEENDVVESNLVVADLPITTTTTNDQKEEVSESVGVADANHIKQPPTTTTTKEWANEEEKQQFSPVSVLDCPFEDEDEEDVTSSPFTHRLARMEGSKKMLMQKIRRFENLADQLKPVDLEKQIALSELEEEEDDEDEEEDRLETPKSRCSMSIYDNDMFDDNNGEESYERARELLKLADTKFQMSTLNFKPEILIMDFLIQSLEEIKVESVSKRIKMERDLVTTIQGWIEGKPQDVYMGWEVKDGRKTYIEDMEKSGKWRNLDDEKKEVVLELEKDIFNFLAEEILLDFF